MSDRDEGSVSAAVLWRSSTGQAVRRRLSTDQIVLWRPSAIQAVLAGAMVAALGVVSIAPAFGPPGRAAATVGFVLAEAIALYVGYGALGRVVESIVHRLLGNE